MKLYEKLHAIQSEINGLGKDKATNTYRYVTGDKVLSHIKPLMNKYKLLLKQEVISIENTRQDYVVSVSKDLPNGRPKSEIHSKVMMKFTWVDVETGDKDENLFGSNGQNDWDKGVGSALTYGERYFLLKYFHIATDEDDIDNPERKAQEEEAQSELEKSIRDVNVITGSEEALKLYIAAKPEAIRKNPQFQAACKAKQKQLTKPQ